MAIDFGAKRVGIAVTDPLRIVASPLVTVESAKALDFIKDYCEKEVVDTIVVGKPLRLSGEETHGTKPAIGFANLLRKSIPNVKIDFEDEQFTSKMAVKAMVAGGMKKKERRKKENIDKVSAAIILQSYLEKE